MSYSHAQLSVVQEILHWVEAGELVQDLRAIGDHTRRGVNGRNSTRDVDVLDVGEVRKLSAPNFIDYLLKKKHISLKSVL